MAIILSFYSFKCIFIYQLPTQLVNLCILSAFNSSYIMICSYKSRVVCYDYAAVFTLPFKPTRPKVVFTSFIVNAILFIICQFRILTLACK